LRKQGAHPSYYNCRQTYLGKDTELCGKKREAIFDEKLSIFEGKIKS